MNGDTHRIYEIPHASIRKETVNAFFNEEIFEEPSGFKER